MADANIITWLIFYVHFCTCNVTKKTYAYNFLVISISFRKKDVTTVSWWQYMFLVSLYLLLLLCFCWCFSVSASCEHILRILTSTFASSLFWKIAILFHSNRINSGKRIILFSELFPFSCSTGYNLFWCILLKKTFFFFKLKHMSNVEEIRLDA